MLFKKHMNLMHLIVYEKATSAFLIGRHVIILLGDYLDYINNLNSINRNDR